MIAYDLVVISARRPHLLRTTLQSLLAALDQPPARVIVHDDVCFAGAERAAAMTEVLAELGRAIRPLVLRTDAPPIGHGPGLAWALGQAEAGYVLYTQDDHEVVRPLPIQRALAVMDAYTLHQVRFNKRDTLDRKGEGPQAFVKEERRFPMSDGLVETLCVADHWYFQTGLWRVAQIRPVVTWWDRHGPGAFAEHCEAKVNDVLNGQWRGRCPVHVDLIPPGAPWNSAAVRAASVRTFIWGRIGEPAFLRHLGTTPADWALNRRRDN